MQYQDDENTFVHLTSDDDLMETYRYLQAVQNCDELYRLCLGVHGSATPVPSHVTAERTNETKRRFTLPPKQLSYPESMATSCTSVTSKPETNKFNLPWMCSWKKRGKQWIIKRHEFHNYKPL